jgi:hypothetical protein
MHGCIVQCRRHYTCVMVSPLVPHTSNAMLVTHPHWRLCLRPILPLQADSEAGEQMTDLLAVLRAVQQRVGATPALRLLDDVLEASQSRYHQESALCFPCSQIHLAVNPDTGTSCSGLIPVKALDS